MSLISNNEDLQMVNITLRVLSKPVISRLPDIHRTIGPDYDEKILPSIVNEVLKSVVVRFSRNTCVHSIPALIPFDKGPVQRFSTYHSKRASQFANQTTTD